MDSKSFLDNFRCTELILEIKRKWIGNFWLFIFHFWFLVLHFSFLVFSFSPQFLVYLFHVLFFIFSFSSLSFLFSFITFCFWFLINFSFFKTKKFQNKMGNLLCHSVTQGVFHQNFLKTFLIALKILLQVAQIPSYFYKHSDVAYH